MGQCKRDITLLLTHWSYIFLALTHWYVNIAAVWFSQFSVLQYFDGLVQDCIISSPSSMEMLQSCTKPSISSVKQMYKPEYGSELLVPMNVAWIWGWDVFISWRASLMRPFIVMTSKLYLKYRWVMLKLERMAYKQPAHILVHTGPFIRGSHVTGYCTVTMRVKHKTSNFELTKGTPYLALEGKLRGAHCEYFGPCYDRNALLGPMKLHQSGKCQPGGQYWSNYFRLNWN